MNAKTSYGGVLGFCLIAGAAFGQPAPALPDEAESVLAPRPGGLTASAVAERSVASSTQVRVRFAEVDAARARLDQTMAQFFPRLTLRASYTRLSPVESDLGGALLGAANPGQVSVGPCPSGAGECVLDAAGTPVGAAAFELPSIADNYALSATLSVPISDYVLRLSNAAAAASASRRAAELNVKAEQLKVRTDAQALFYDWLRAQARVAIAQQSLERTRARLKDAEPAYQLGAITKADLLRLEALAASTEQVVLEADGFRALTELQLSLAMGDKEPRRYVTGEDVSGTPAPLPGTLGMLTREALGKRLELEALQETVRSLRDGARALSASMYPRVDAFGDVTYANPNQRYFPPQQEWRATWSVGASATWTVGDVFLNDAGAREIGAQARGLDAQRAALADGIRQEVAGQYLARERAAGALAAARRGLAASQEAYRVAVDLYRVGQATTTEVIEAEGDLLSARLNELNARIELRIADVRLRHAVGRDVRR